MSVLCSLANEGSIHQATSRGAPAKYPGDLVCIGRSAAPRLRHIQRRSGCRQYSGVIRSRILGSIKCPCDSALIADLCARARRSQQSALVLRLGIVRPSDQGTPRNARDRSEVRMRLHYFVRFSAWRYRSHAKRPLSHAAEHDQKRSLRERIFFSTKSHNTNRQ